MAGFKAGDRVVKMSGAAAGKYGTVNSVREGGTLNVTFDGERLPRYCDPMRCGQVAANAKFKVGDMVKVVGKGLASKGWVGKVVKVDASKKGWPYKVSFDGREDGEYAEAEIVAANAAKPVGVYRGCKISVADHSPDDVTRPGKTYIVEDADGVSVGGFVTSDAAKRWCDQHPSRCVNARAANAVRNERIRAYPDGPGEWILVDAVGDEGIGRTTATDERGIKAQLADIAVRTYRWHRPEIVIMREKYYSNAARNADYDIEKFEVGKIYRAPWDRNWLAKVLSRTDSSVEVAIKSARDKTWHGADEQVTLRINPRKSEEQGAEVAKGWDWEFWADIKA